MALEYLALAASGLAIGLAVSPLTCTALLVMLIMGAAYNVPPIRLKDRAYVDVLSESVNDAVRLLVGWFALTSVFLPPSSLVLGYWMGSAFLMSVKRMAECRAFAEHETPRSIAARSATTPPSGSWSSHWCARWQPRSSSACSS